MAESKRIFKVTAFTTPARKPTAGKDTLPGRHDDAGADDVTGKLRDSGKKIGLNKASGKSRTNSEKEDVFSAVIAKPLEGVSMEQDKENENQSDQVVREAQPEFAVKNKLVKDSSTTLINVRCNENNTLTELSQTPPTAQAIPVPSPKAPVKPRKQFDKKILKPKKLIYNDKENEKSDEEDNSVPRTPTTRKLENLGNIKRPSNGTTPKKSKQKDDFITKKFQNTDGIAGKDEPSRSNIKGQETRKKNLNATTDEARKIRKSNNGKGELSTDKENNENLGKENEESKQNVEKHKTSTNTNKKQIFYGDHFMTKNLKYSFLLNRDDSSTSAELSRQHTNERDSRLHDYLLSQPCQNLDWADKLRWLQPRRDVGLWIQCCRRYCGKWRYVDSIHDPLDVPKMWYCHMNPDNTLNTCSATETRLTPSQAEDLIENKYNAGSIVWAKIKGYPWWPGMVDDCPDTAQYYLLNDYSIVPTHYNVTFFEINSALHEWVKPASIKPFFGNEKGSFVNKTTIHGSMYNEELDEAIREAHTALSLPILERLQRYSFVSRFEGPNDNPAMNLAVAKSTEKLPQNEVRGKRVMKIDSLNGNDSDDNEKYKKRPRRQRKRAAKNVKSKELRKAFNLALEVGNDAAKDTAYENNSNNDVDKIASNEQNEARNVNNCDPIYNDNAQTTDNILTESGPIFICNAIPIQGQIELDVHGNVSGVTTYEGDHEFQNITNEIVSSVDNHVNVDNDATDWFTNPESFNHNKEKERASAKNSGKSVELQNKKGLDDGNDTRSINSSIFNNSTDTTSRAESPVCQEMCTMSNQLIMRSVEKLVDEILKPTSAKKQMLDENFVTTEAIIQEANFRKRNINEKPARLFEDELVESSQTLVVESKSRMAVIKAKSQRSKTSLENSTGKLPKGQIDNGQNQSLSVQETLKEKHNKVKEFGNGVISPNEFENTRTAVNKSSMGMLFRLKEKRLEPREREEQNLRENEVRYGIKKSLNEITHETRGKILLSPPVSEIEGNDMQSVSGSDITPSKRQKRHGKQKVPAIEPNRRTTRQSVRARVLSKINDNSSVGSFFESIEMTRKKLNTVQPANSDILNNKLNARELRNENIENDFKLELDDESFESVLGINNLEGLDADWQDHDLSQNSMKSDEEYII